MKAKPCKLGLMCKEAATFSIALTGVGRNGRIGLINGAAP
jgi:hypothetical protein